MIKVLIADDHAIVRRGLKQIVAETGDIVVGGEAINGDEVMEQVRAKSFDVVVLDITMPGRNGLDTLKELKREQPRLPVLMLSMHAEDQYAMRVMKAGAAGYLPKEGAPEELVNAIRKVHSGAQYIRPSQVDRMARSMHLDSNKPPHELLSDREYEVLRMIASGKTPTQIAEELSLSVKTVSTYRARLLEKMMMKNNAELTHYAIKNTLVS
ncbi:MAG TPA: response regulator transcription factor [Verrucomicrobiae bacterium]|jgi:DNA-binding NarL/FixJ family response regulator